jgi:hypothetical protein
MTYQNRLMSRRARNGDMWGLRQHDLPRCRVFGILWENVRRSNLKIFNSSEKFKIPISDSQNGIRLRIGTILGHVCWFVSIQARRFDPPNRRKMS